MHIKRNLSNQFYWKGTHCCFSTDTHNSIFIVILKYIPLCYIKIRVQLTLCLYPIGIRRSDNINKSDFHYLIFYPRPIRSLSELVYIESQRCCTNIVDFYILGLVTQPLLLHRIVINLERNSFYTYIPLGQEGFNINCIISF